MKRDAMSARPFGGIDEHFGDTCEPGQAQNAYHKLLDLIQQVTADENGHTLFSEIVDKVTAPWPTRALCSVQLRG
jgi:hypothetical protein